MQFEKYDEGERIIDGTKYKHGLVFEADKGEVEIIAAVYREKIDRMVENGEFSSITKDHRHIAQWDEESDHTLSTNAPLHTARLLEVFHEGTEQAVRRIQTEGSGSAFDSLDIARRMDLGDMALQLSATIRLEFDQNGVSEDFEKMFKEHGMELFTSNEDAPQGPFDNS